MKQESDKTTVYIYSATKEIMLLWLELAVGGPPYWQGRSTVRRVNISPRDTGERPESSSWLTQLCLMATVWYAESTLSLLRRRTPRDHSFNKTLTTYQHTISRKTSYSGKNACHFVLNQLFPNNSLLFFLNVLSHSLLSDTLLQDLRLRKVVSLVIQCRVVL
jgi:hypothetical protein